jgi:two-component system response regulator AtoC
VLTPAVAAALEGYAWPGNVRELRNAMERLALVGELSSQVRPAPAGAAAAPPPAAYHEARQEAIDRFERDYCRQVVAFAGGVVRAAEHAGISRQMLHRLMRKHDLRGE